ncbi:CHAT domain-containing protein [Streptosporangiaceae bacterium NEAU-GS5]|nr:CHAT domain-containing protein [Streptosporangiaceae bacterium NEAU-GS5]
MGLLADVIDAPGEVPTGGGADSEAARCWWFWLAALRHKQVNEFDAAREALREGAGRAEALGWTHMTAPIWYAESGALHGALLHDDGDHGAAAEALERALLGWRLIGAVLGGGAPDQDFTHAVFDGAVTMTRALAGHAVLDDRAAALGATPLEVAVAGFAADRFVPMIYEVAARAIQLTGRVRSYAEARRLANETLNASRHWSPPSWDDVDFEITIRTSLAHAASAAGNHRAALGQAEDAVALTRRLRPGRARERREAEAHANRASKLYALGRPAEAAGDYAVATERLLRLDQPEDALRTRAALLHARASSGEAVALAEVRALLAEMERFAADTRGRGGALMEDLEYLRRRHLVLLAAEDGGGQDDDGLDEIILLVEQLRGDRPLLRDGSPHPDPVVARLRRPFGVGATRLAALPDTVLLALEPGIGNAAGLTDPPVVLTVAGGGPGRARWRLAEGGREMHDALRELTNVAARERDRLNTRESPLHGPPSPALRQAAAQAWLSLPAPARAALLAARTVIYLPSPAANLDRLPLELLLHDGGWLGETHVVARCPSFEYLEEVLAPNARRRRPPARATVAHVAPIERLGALEEAEADARTAMRAAPLLGLEPRSRQITTADGLRELFTGTALVHYVGHGFASELGEWLPVSHDRGVTPSEVSWADDQDAPVVFFNACLLGRVRHIAGGRQKGWAVTLLKHGSPAVIGALDAVPDAACAAMAREIYRAAWRAPLGEALRLARQRFGASGYHPLIAGAYVLHGDPYAMLSRASGAAGPRAAADLTTRWPAHLTRYLATGEPAHRDLLLAALHDAPPPVRTRLHSWALGQDGTAEWPALIDDLLDVDAEGAGALRVVVGAERLDRDGDDPGRAEEARATYLAAAALEDGYAMAHLLTRHHDLWRSLFPAEQEALRDVPQMYL